MLGYGRMRRQSVNYTISYRAAHAAAVRRVAAPYNRSITALRRLYAGKTPHFNIPQERRAPAE